MSNNNSHVVLETPHVQLELFGKNLPGNKYNRHFHTPFEGLAGALAEGWRGTVTTKLADMNFKMTPQTLRQANRIMGLPTPSHLSSGITAWLVHITHITRAVPVIYIPRTRTNVTARVPLECPEEYRVLAADLMRAIATVCALKQCETSRHDSSLEQQINMLQDGTTRDVYMSLGKRGGGWVEPVEINMYARQWMREHKWPATLVPEKITYVLNGG